LSGSRIDASSTLARFSDAASGFQLHLAHVARAFLALLATDTMLANQVFDPPRRGRETGHGVIPCDGFALSRHGDAAMLSW
jgi:hypothetical protein